ncbi:MAG: iron ABC transporter permease [Planctomycetota bacterium]
MTSTLMACIIGGIVILPLAWLGVTSAQNSDGTWRHLYETVLAGYVINTLLLAAGVGLGTTLIGVGTAWLVTMFRFPGHRMFRWMLLLPLAIPSYLLAYAATDMMQFSGPIQTALRDSTGWSRQDYWFPDIRTLPGAIAVLTLCLYPYVYLATRTAFIEQSACVLEAARTLGCGSTRLLIRVAMPMARPSIVAGLALVMMETLAEFGAVDYCAVDTLATGIYRTWFARGSIVGAAQLSLCLLALIVLVLGFETIARGSARFHHATCRRQPLRRKPLSTWQGLLATCVCGMPIVLGFVLPVVCFAAMTIRSGDARAAELLWGLGKNSVTLAGISASVVVIMATLLTFGTFLNPSRFNRSCRRISRLGYAIPGGVIAIGVLAAAWSVEEWVNDIADTILGWSPGLFISGTIVAVLLGYQTRFLSVGLGIIDAGMTRIRPSLGQAALTLGRSPVQALVHIHTPLLRSSLFCAALLVFVDVLKELPATLILRPFNVDTLAVRVYQLASDERLAEASTSSLAIIVAGLVPVVILSRWMETDSAGNESKSIGTAG